MNDHLPRLPLGISDFAKLRQAGEPYLYVDKTGALLGMLQAGTYLFLARPRRFGKSLLCSTMRYLYEGRRELFAGLAIEPLWDWSKTNPVVHLDMTSFDCSSVEALRQALLNALGAESEACGITLTGRLLPDDFKTLLKGICEKSGRRVIVIVDEYEKPVHDHLGDPDLAKKMRDVLSAFYGALKGCDAYLEKVFITGIGRMVRTSIFSELNQMKDLTLLAEAAEVCGYTEDELRRDFAAFVPGMAEANGLTPQETWEKLRERYNGYWWGKGQRVYNPWAILNCFSDREFGSYWWSSGTPGMLLTMAEKLGRPDQDLEGIEATEMSLLFDISKPAPVPLLWQSGYLTIRSIMDRVYTLGFPNAEVREAWFGMMLERFCGPGFEGAQTTAAVMLSALSRRDRPRFERALTALFAAIPGELHGGREAFYHAVFAAALQAVGGEILAESRTDKGRSDAVIKTRETIYIVEFKLGTAEAALAQIRARRYFEPYLTDSRPVVLLAAGGFAEREIRCLWEEVQK